MKKAIDKMGRIIIQYWILIFLGTLPLLTTAQNDKTDSLKTVFENIELHDTVRVKALEALTWFYYSRDNQQFFKYAQEYLDFSKKIDIEKWKAKAYNTLGVGYYLNDYGIDTIINTYQKGLLIAQKNKFYGTESSLYNNIGLAYSKIGQMEKTITFYKKGLNLSKKINDQTKIARNLYNIAVLLRRNRQSNIQAMTVENA